MPQVRILSSGPNIQPPLLRVLDISVCKALFTLWHLASKARNLLWGSEATAAGGGRKELSEWQRSADEDAAPSATNMPGTATGTPLISNPVIRTIQPKITFTVIFGWIISYIKINMY